MKKVFALALILTFLSGILYGLFEPEILKSANVSVTQTVLSEVSMVCDSQVSGLSSINGVTGGTSNGTFSCTVVTNNEGGYNLTLKKSGPLCHQSGCGTNQQFDDYPGTTTDPIDFNWQNAGADQEYWGFNVASSTDPTDITQRFKDDGSQCNSGNNVSNEKCWVRIPTDPNIEMIGNRNTWTSQSGTTITIGIRIQAGSNNFLKSGNYTTTLVATAAMN